MSDASRVDASRLPGWGQGLEFARQLGRCGWCGKTWTRKRRDTKFCAVQCRKRAFRFRRLFPAGLPPATGGGLRIVYADPPYIGKAWMYANHPDYGGEVNHVELIAGLERRRKTGEIHGWALSCSKRSLRLLLPLCPPEADWAPWVKTTPVLSTTSGPQSRVECVIWVGGRACRPGVPDFLHAPPARDRTSDLVGRKPPAFAAWLFQILGLVPGDELEDMFPGTGQVGRAWQEICRSVLGRSRTDASRVDASAIETGRQPSLLASGRVPAGPGTPAVPRGRGTRSVPPRGETRPARRRDASPAPGVRVASRFPRGRVPDVEGTLPITSRPVVAEPR